MEVVGVDFLTVICHLSLPGQGVHISYILRVWRALIFGSWGKLCYLCYQEKRI